MGYIKSPTRWKKWFALFMGTFLFTLQLRNLRKAEQATTATISEYDDAFLEQPKHYVQVETTKPHDPRRFSSQPPNYTLYAQRGWNLFTTLSGCRIAAWVYQQMDNSKIRLLDCSLEHSPKPKSLRWKSKFGRVQANDTIYVPFLHLDDFVQRFLPNLTVPVVVLTGQQQKILPHLTNQTQAAILNHPKVLHWFTQNLDWTGGTDLSHPKLSPFPFGLKEKPLGGGFLRKTLTTYRTMLQQNVLQHPALNNNRTRILFLGPMALTPERQHLLGMTGVVNSSKLSFTRYLEEIQSSRYILSPNGDRPECYRHYEAIGMGTIPVTQLDSVRYRHLQGAVIYANAEWKNMTALEEQLLEGRLRPSTTHDDDDHRAMVLEEYWMEYVERVVGRPLRWWDRKRGRPSLIEDLELTTTTTG